MFHNHDEICPDQSFRGIESRQIHSLLLAHPLRLDDGIGVKRIAASSGPRSVMVCSYDGDILSVSPEFERHTGYGLMDTIGRNPRFLQGPGTTQASINQFRSILSERKPGTVTVVNYKKSGEPFLTVVSLMPIFDKDGRLAVFTALNSPKADA